MFEFLEQLEARLYVRYLTVERNIKSASNSFYDSYLDLQEQLIKLVCNRFGIEVLVHETCGQALKRDDVKNILLSTLGIDEFTFNKLQDYTLKVNAHKHKKEKTIQVDTIVTYMRVFYEAAASFAKYDNIIAEPFDANYYVNIFGIFEKENDRLKGEVEGLKEELKSSVEQGKLKDSDIAAFKGLLSQAEIDKMSLEDQNAELQKQISKLKDIKLSSMEEKLNKTIDLLINLNDEIQENRIATDAVYRSITGDNIKTAIKEIKDNE